MLRNLPLILIILGLALVPSCTALRLYDRLSSNDLEKSKLQPGDYLISQLGNNRVLVNRDFSYTTMTYSNISRDFDVIMTFSLFQLGGLSRSCLK